VTPGAGAHRRLLAGALLGALLAPAFLTGCAESVDPIERLGRKAAEKVPQRAPGAAKQPAVPVPRCAHRFRTAETAPKEPRGKKIRCPDKAKPGAAKPGGTPKP
jgi:hypothetical protein